MILGDSEPQDDFPWFLSPLNEEEFVSRYWAKRPLRISRDDQEYYLRLFPETEMELALHAASQFRGAIELLSEDDGPQNCRSHKHAIEGFRSGKSIRIDGVQRFSHGIKMLARNLEASVHCSVNVNMYLTPGAGKKALDRHYDTHDVFVLQVHGNKVWRLYDPPFPFPLEYVPLQRDESMRDMRRSRLDHDLSGRDSCTLKEEFTLKAGDCLYLPRGFWHEAESKPGEVSCHLTVGIQPTTYLDVLSVAISKVALSDPRLREPLPFGFAQDPTAGRTVAARVAEIVGDLPAVLNAEGALEKVAAHSLRSHNTGFRNNLLRRFGTPSEGLNGESKIQVRKGMFCAVDGSTSPARMIFGRNAFEIAPAYEDACRFIANTRVFSVSDLPGGLELPEKLALIQQLMTEGLLTVPSDPTTANEPSRERAGWLPIRLDLRTDTVEWLEFGNRPLAEPFFEQSVRRLKREKPNARMRSTKLQALSNSSEEITPSGFIFHMSRCGSTLLSNGLRSIRGTIVISEAQPIGEAVMPLSSETTDTNGKGLEDSGGGLLRNVIQAYGRKGGNPDNALVIKFSSWNIMNIAAVRSVWPDVPCVIITRDPLEVAVSCLEEPPGWMRSGTRSRIGQAVLGKDAEDAASMPDSVFCARGLGAFLKSASNASSQGCQIIDYKDLSTSTVVQVAQLFGIEVAEEDIKNIQESFSVYSKDSVGKRVFISDNEAKQAKATSELRKEVQIWAQPAYDNIEHRRLLGAR